MTTKLEALIDGAWMPVRHPGTFAVESTSGGDRLLIAARERHAQVLLDLAADLRSPFKVLYVLHTPRGESPEGRYESPALESGVLVNFVRRFSYFLSGDGRHDLWVHSREDDATLVWDRHDLIYAYGPLRAFEATLERSGLRPGDAMPPPSPHRHLYHPEWDASERELVACLDWKVTALREGDRPSDRGRT